MVLGIVVPTASMVSVELGLSIAVIEILLGTAAALLLLMWLGARAQSHEVLPAFLLGLALARTMQRNQSQPHGPETDPWLEWALCGK
jgi:hypothetical protein